MYGVVLLAAMTAGGSSPECFFGRGCCACYGGYGGCYGGYGGCGGGYGGCGGGYGGCGGGYGGCYGGCYGGSGGCYGGWGMSYGGYGPGYASVMPGVPVTSAPVREERASAKQAEVREARAKVIFDLPSDAKLYVDGQPIKGAAEKKNFRTPELEKGQEYYYEMRAEVMRDGKPVSETRRIIVRAGAVIRADFSSLGAASGVASAKKSR